MAFPTIDAVNSGFETAASTSHPINLPSGIVAGKLLIVILTSSAAPTISGWPAGWTSIGSGVLDISSGYGRIDVRYKIATGSETNFTLTSSSSTATSHNSYRIGAWHGITPPEASAIAFGSGTAPNPASLNPTGWGAEDTLWMALTGYNNSSAATSYPTNYSLNQSNVGSASAFVRQAIAARNLNAASEDPGAFAIAAAGHWSAFTLAVRPAVPNVPPSAGFTYVVTNFSVAFTDTSTDPDGTIASRAWDFGDGGTSTVANPTHVYAASGSYTVRLTVTDNVGDSTYAEHTVIVSVEPPVADFSASGSGLAFTFTDASSDPDGTIASRAWDFGDGGTSTATNPTHTYASAGTYSVTLTVTDNSGLTNSKTISVTATTSVGSPPVASFTKSGTGLTRAFVDTSTDPDGTIVSRAWNFGDGATSAATNPSHTYAIGGQYTVTLVVTDNSGNTASTQQAVVVIKAQFSVSGSNLVRQFTDTSVGNIASRLWNFGDGQTSTSTNPLHTYAVEGTYTVTLTVTETGSGVTASATATVFAFGPGSGLRVVVSAGQEGLDAYVATPVQLKGGKTYSWRARVHCPEPTGIRLDLIYLQEAGGGFRQAALAGASGVTTLSPGWNDISGSATLPSDWNPDSRLVLRPPRKSDNTGYDSTKVFYYDKLQVELGPTVTAWELGSIGGGMPVTTIAGDQLVHDAADDLIPDRAYRWRARSFDGVVYGEWSDWQTWTYRAAPVASWSFPTPGLIKNRIDDPSYEHADVSAFWTYLNEVTDADFILLADDGDAAFGFRSWVATESETSTNEMVSATKSVDSTKPFIAYTHAKKESGISRTNFIVEFLDAENAVIGSTHPAYPTGGFAGLTDTDLPTSYTAFGGVVWPIGSANSPAMPSGTTQVRFRFIPSSLSEAVVRVDGFFFSELPNVSAADMPDAVKWYGYFDGDQVSYDLSPGAFGYTWSGNAGDSESFGLRIARDGNLNLFITYTHPTRGDASKTGDKLTIREKYGENDWKIVYKDLGFTGGNRSKIPIPTGILKSERRYEFVVEVQDDIGISAASSTLVVDVRYEGPPQLNIVIARADDNQAQVHLVFDSSLLSLTQFAGIEIAKGEVPEIVDRLSDPTQTNWVDHFPLSGSPEPYWVRQLELRGVDEVAGRWDRVEVTPSYINWWIKDIEDPAAIAVEFIVLSGDPYTTDFTAPQDSYRPWGESLPVHITGEGRESSGSITMRFLNDIDAIVVPKLNQLAKFIKRRKAVAFLSQRPPRVRYVTLTGIQETTEHLPYYASYELSWEETNYSPDYYDRTGIVL